MQLTTQPGSCSPPPGTYRSGATISLLLGRCSSVRLQNTRLLSIWTGANEAVGNMKLFNNHSGLRGLPCLAEGIYWATGLSRTTPFTEGRLGVNNKASPPGRHQEQAPKQRCTFRPTTFSSVQCLAWTSLGIILFLRSLYSKFSSDVPGALSRSFC